MAATGRAAKFGIAASQLPHDALLQLRRRCAAQERLKRPATGSVHAHVEQLTWCQLSNALGKCCACLLLMELPHLPHASQQHHAGDQRGIMRHPNQCVLQVDTFLSSHHCTLDGDQKPSTMWRDQDMLNSGLQRPGIHLVEAHDCAQHGSAQRGQACPPRRLS